MVIPEDPILRDMLADFVESWKRDVSHKLTDIVTKKDDVELFRFGHTLRGSGRQFGMLGMSDYGALLQDFAREQQWDSASNLIPVLQSELHTIQQYLIDRGIAPSDRFSALPSNL